MKRNGSSQKYISTVKGSEDRASPKKARPSYITLTTHPGTSHTAGFKVSWGEKDPLKRGPLLATDPSTRNVIGAHGGSYSVYRGLALAQGAMDRAHTPKLYATRPIIDLPQQPSWSDPTKIGCMDPFGHDIVGSFGDYLRRGYDIRPTIAVTRAHIDVPEVNFGVKSGRLKPDGKILLASGQANIKKMAVEPVWYLPEMARRFGITETELRRSMFEETNGMYPELMTRNDIKVFMPPIGGLTIYVFGDVSAITDPDKMLAVRVHDECNGSDVFGSDICTCRPYLIHGIEVCIKTAQEGGAGIIVYFRKEGRALGEVTKYLVYNLRKRQEGGDKASEYFSCTKQVAGIEDVRFQSMMPDALHWLGVTRIDKFISMSDMKYNAIVKTGIKIVERVPIPKDLIPADAHVEINAKVFAGYHGGTVYESVDKKLVDATFGRESHDATKKTDDNTTA